MPDCIIRQYKDSDYDVTRNLFASGIEEHVIRLFYHVLGRTHIWLSLIAVFIVILHVVSLTMAILTVATVIVCIWFGARHIYISYVQYALSDDMMNIRKYYQEREGYCFWVAEVAGEVVGTVAALPSSLPGGENHQELKRLSVSKRHRGKGISKRLLRTMVDFARKRGCEAVVLTTTLMQIEAWTMYEKMGFSRTQTYNPPGILAKVLDFHILVYQYDIPQGQ